MTARRLSKISSDILNPPSRHERFRRRLNAINEDRWDEDEAGGTLQEALNSELLRFTREVPDETAAPPVVHPALTDYGPDSAANFLRLAPANQQRALQGPTATLRARRRPRNRRVSQMKAGNVSSSLLFPFWQSTGLREGSDLLGSSDAEDKLLSYTPGASMDARNSFQRASEQLPGKDESTVALQRTGSKRARRASTRKGKTNEENTPQSYDLPHGAALLRRIRLRRIEPHNQGDLNEGSSNVWNAQDIREPTTSIGACSRVNEYGRPAYAEPAERPMQAMLQGTGEQGELLWEDDLIGDTCPQTCMEDDVLSDDDQWSPFRAPQAQPSMNSVRRRRSRPSSPLDTSQASRKQVLHDSNFGAFLEPKEHEYEGSDGDSASSGEGIALNHSLSDLHPNLLRSTRLNLRSRTERHNNEESISPFLGYLTVPTSFAEQQQSSLQPSASTLFNGDLSPQSQSLQNEQIISKESDQKEQNLSIQHTLAQKGGQTEVVMTTNSLASRDTTVLSTSNYEPAPVGIPPQEPFVCQPRGTSCGWPDLPTEIYLEIARYLSREDTLNLRLVCCDFSIALVGAVFGSVVVPFGRAMYNINSTNWEPNPPSSSMFEKYGLAIRKFGISFEADPDMIAKAQTKTISGEQSSWWGSYRWPTPEYPRFNDLHVLENLADNVSLLKSAMAHLGKTHELGLSVDSGHGWLNGPDISDMALFDARCGKRTRVFGKNLPAEDKQKQATRLKLFECAQARTLQECMEILQRHNSLFTSNELNFLRSVAVRDMESFRSIMRQPDYDSAAHVGGAIPLASTAAHGAQHANGGQPLVGGPHQPPNGGMNAVLHHLAIGNLNAMGHNGPPTNHNPPQHNIPASDPAIYHNGTVLASPTQSNISTTTLTPQARSGFQQATVDGTRPQAGVAKVGRRVPKVQPQFPIIMNGYNISAEIGGWCHLIQRNVAPPKSFPLQPGSLTEAQAQWLMEIVWAQRAFLSAFTTAVLANKTCFAQVHSLHIAKISSGLLSSLEQKELWQGLPGLTTLTVLVSPDWRVEHITGDQTFNTNMLVSPVNASLQLSDFLKTYIAPIEKLSNLTIGFVGGGEHATGIMARNQHVLPAPISSAPRMWLSDHITKPEPCTILTFNHIKHLTVQNAWVSSLMLEAFMIKSQDTSLRTLTLQSVSLTATHSQRPVAPLTTATESLHPVHPPSMWLHESLPTTHCWPATIDRITPGATFLDRKYDAGMLDPYTNPRPQPSFRGFVSRLIFSSCGYVRISGLSIQNFNQNDLVYPNSDPMDAGLRARAAALAEKGVMLSDKKPNTGEDWPLLGKLVQCIHPVEKRVLEQAWGMKFGWDDNLDRWGPVEDGCFEGGTGRFSGVIVGEGGRGTAGVGE